MKKCHLYWIHLPEHNNILEQGYIGIANNVKKRWEVHKYSPENPHLKNAVNKHGWDNLVKEILLIADREYCTNIEEKLRPNKGIGWNIAKGGDNPPILYGKDNYFFGKGHLMSGKNCRFFKGPIIATNMSTGEKRIFNGNKELKNAGFEQTNVSKCVLGKRKSHLNHTFIQISHGEIPGGEKT